MKNSIKVFITIATIYAGGTTLKAQNVSAKTGIYQTEQDYKAGKLSYVLTDHDKLQLNEFLEGKNISLNYQGKKVKLAKSEIFGYRMDARDFRFYDNKAYQILDTAGFLLYSRDKLTQSVKGAKPEEAYFFSVNTSGPVTLLTIQNLSDSFLKQTDFRYSLQSDFHNDAELMTYDKFTHQYKIKYLYFQQKQSAMTARN